MALELLTANVDLPKGTSFRRAQLNGREYIVVPLTMIVPGVLNGNKGPLLYQESDIQQSVDAWNHMPIVVNHPYENGRSISARDPLVLEKYGVGLVFASRYDNGLKAEGWFDVEKTQRIDNRVLNALEKNQPQELSTGLFTDNERAEEGANLNGTVYEAIARNFRPDHLAVLPDQKGACSLKDGCGVLVNEDHVQTLVKKELSNMAKKETIDFLIQNCDCWNEDDRKHLETLSDDKLGELKTNTEKVLNQAKVADAALKGFKDGERHFTYNAEKGEFVAKEEPKKKETTSNATTNEQTPVKPKTTEEWLSEAPPEIQAVVNRSLEKEAAEKKALIEKIKTNKRNTFTDEQLDGFTIQQLEPIANMAVEPKPKPDYTGAAGGPSTNTTTNEDDDDEPLALPTMNWGEEKKD